MPSYNGEKYIKEQIESILCQLSEDDEIILSDDSSTDSTLEIVSDFKDNRIKILGNNKFYSPIYNLENAIKHATGEYIFLADQDDIWMPNKVEVMLKALKNVDLCVSDCELINTNREIIHQSFFELNHSKKGFLRNLIKNSYLGCCIAFSRDILSYILPFPAKIAMHDIWIGLCVELWGKSVFIDEKLIKYRRHGENVSPAAEKSKYTLSYKIKYRLYFIYQLLKRRTIIK
jgi:glycosyltransferase involved in cell wall biosynthesis